MVLTHYCKLLAMVLWLTGFVPVSLAQEIDSDTPAADLRLYGEGPLQAADYRAKVPSPLPTAGNTRLLAFTWTRIKYEYQYDYVQQGSTFMVTVTEFDSTAFIDRAVSWNALTRDRRLMDHEQGHFDIAHLASLRFRWQVEQLRKAGTPISAQGPLLRGALQQIDQKLSDLSQKHSKAATAEHTRYDQMTSHGTLGSAQQDARKKQQKAIKQLTQKLVPAQNAQDLLQLE